MQNPISGTDTGMSRRHLLKAASAAPLAVLPAALPAAAAPASTPETPIAAMWREITRLQAWSDGPGMTVPEAELEAVIDDLFDLANAIVHLPSQGPMDFLFKLMGHTVNGQHCPCGCPGHDELMQEAMRWVGYEEARA